jgi:hypothetical protein
MFLFQVNYIAETATLAWHKLLYNKLCHRCKMECADLEVGFNLHKQQAFTVERRTANINNISVTMMATSWTIFSFCYTQQQISAWNTN